MVAAPPAPVDRRPSNLAAAADPSQRRSWFKVSNLGGERGTGTVSNAARVDIYEEIGGWGVTAQDFADALRAVDASEVHLHVNSPGGSVFDGLAIFNSIAAHPARFVGYVDGLAASAASFIIQACDEIEMNKGSMMMLHDAIAMTWGNAFDHRDSADLLDKVGSSIASVYASRAGGTAETWAAVMAEKNGQGRWYTADEAVEAGLADRVAGTVAGQQDGEPVEPAQDDAREVFDRSSIAAGHRLVAAQRDDALAALARMPVTTAHITRETADKTGVSTADPEAFAMAWLAAHPIESDPLPAWLLGTGK
jgi:ATP-dependent protease ClpP protease subunit